MGLGGRWGAEQVEVGVEPASTDSLKKLGVKLALDFVGVA